MKFSKKYTAFFLSIAVLAATSAHYIDAAKKDTVKKEKKKKSLFTKIKKSFTKFFTGKWKRMNKNDWLRVVGTTLFTGVSGYSFYWMFFKKNKEGVTPIERIIAPGPVPPLSADLFDSGWNRVRTQDNQIRNVRLRRVRVIGQRGQTCAYHAIRNSSVMLNILNSNNNLEQDIPVLINHQLATSVIERWRQLVINRNRAENERRRTNHVQQSAESRRPLVLLRVDGENLNSDEIFSVIQGIPGIEHENFTIYDDSAQIGREDFDLDMLNIKNNFNSNANYRHVFIINTLDSTPKNQNKINKDVKYNSNGHWYSVVVNQTINEQNECFREYIFMDSSANADIVHHRSGIWRLMAALEDE